MHPGVNSEKMFGWGSYWSLNCFQEVWTTVWWEASIYLKRHLPNKTRKAVWMSTYFTHTLVAIVISLLSLMIHHYLWWFIIISDDERINVYTFIYANWLEIVAFFKIFFLLTACAKIWLVFEHLETLCGIYYLV